MISPANSYSNESDSIGANHSCWMIAVFWTAVLTGIASFWWSGLALGGVALLALAAVCILLSLIISWRSGQPAWGMAIVGQAAGVVGTAVLLLAALL